MQLTEKERKILAFLERCLKERGYPPTVREICSELECHSSSTGKRYLDQLENQGYIRRNPLKPRAVEILVGSDGKRRCSVNTVEPRMLPEIGDTAAGLPITAIQHCNAYIPVPLEDFSHGELFILRVHGESMVNAGIFDGDKIICERSDTAKNGDIVVALMEDSATVKRFYREDGYIRLQPENDYMEPIIIEEGSDFVIQGVVTGVIRMLR